MKNKKRLIKRIFGIVSCIVIIVSTFTITTSAHIAEPTDSWYLNAPFRYTTIFTGYEGTRLHVNGVNEILSVKGEQTPTETRVDFSGLAGVQDGVNKYYSGYQQMKLNEISMELTPGNIKTYYITEIQERYKQNYNTTNSSILYVINTVFDYLITDNPYSKGENEIIIANEEFKNELQLYSFSTDIQNSVNNNFINDNFTDIYTSVEYTVNIPIKHETIKDLEQETGYYNVATIERTITYDNQLGEKLYIFDPIEIKNAIEQLFEDEYDSYTLIEELPIIFTNVKLTTQINCRGNIEIAENVTSTNMMISRNINVPSYYKDKSFITGTKPEQYSTSYDLEWVFLEMYENSDITATGKITLQNFNLLEWISTTINTFMDIEIIPNVTFGNIIWIIVGIGLLFLILKVFFGG